MHMECREPLHHYQITELLIQFISHTLEWVSFNTATNGILRHQLSKWHVCNRSDTIRSEPLSDSAIDLATVDDTDLRYALTDTIIHMLPALTNSAVQVS
jgi:hypothetical protein